MLVNEKKLRCLAFWVIFFGSDFFGLSLTFALFTGFGFIPWFIIIWLALVGFGFWFVGALLAIIVFSFS